MKAFVTTLFVSLTLMTFGQNPNLGLNETPRHIVDKAVANWKAKNATLTAAANQASFNAGTTMAAEFAFADETLDGIESIDRGLWNETTTWDCACIPTAEHNVTVRHEVTLSADAAVGSLLLDNGGRLLANDPATLTFKGNLTSVEAQPASSQISLIADNAGAMQMLDATMSISNLTVANRTALDVYGSIKAYGNIEINDATLAIDADATLTLGEDEMGRATILRKNGGNVIGKLTREIFLAANPNRNMSLVEQRITVGLEGVTVAEFVGDIPTWASTVLTIRSGFSSIGYWSATAHLELRCCFKYQRHLACFRRGLLGPGRHGIVHVDVFWDVARTTILDIPQTHSTFWLATPPTPTSSLNAIDAQFGEQHELSLLEHTHLQFDQYISGLSTNELMPPCNPTPRVNLPLLV